MPFVALDLPLGDCYNAYYAMLAKFALKQLDDQAYVRLALLSFPVVNSSCEASPGAHELLSTACC